MASRRIMIMAGGTGGHVIPGLTIAKLLQQQDCEIHWFGTEQGIEAKLVPEAGIKLHCIKIAGLRGSGWRGYFTAPWKVLMAIKQSYAVFKQVNPDLVLGMGGYVTGPGGIAAKLLKKPLIIHEQNTRAGLTNRILQHFAKYILQGFPNTFKAKTNVIYTGNPVSDKILQIADPEKRFEVRQTAPLRVLVLGGSQGAQAINEALITALKQPLGDVAFEFWHQCGAKNVEACQAAYQDAAYPVTLDGFIADMDKAYDWADLIIARAGALTVSEIAASGNASILIPYPYAVDDHQTSNADYLVQQQAAKILPQSHLNGNKLREIFRNFAEDRQQLLHMANRAKAMAMPEASAHIVKYCLGEAHG